MPTRSTIAILCLVCACSAGPGPGWPRGPTGSVGPTGAPNESQGRDGGSGDLSQGQPAGGTSGGPSAGPTAYCDSDGTLCTCTTDPAYGHTDGAHCGPAEVGSPSLCCATDAWPGSSPASASAVECVCSRIYCTESLLGDFCSCSFAVPDPSQGDKPTSSCTGKHCCVTPSLIAPICACWTSDAPCSSGDIAVSSCEPSSLRCDEKEVSACN
jgi:hypothetical protein